MRKKTDINKVFGKMPEARELLENNMEKELRKKILSELKEWDCIKYEYDALGITEQIMNIIKPLIPENDSKRESDGVRGELQELINMITADKYPKMDGSHRLDHKKAINLIIQINNEL